MAQEMSETGSIYTLNLSTSDSFGVDRGAPKYLSDDIKIYILINTIPRCSTQAFLGFFKIFIFPTPGR